MAADFAENAEGSMLKAETGHFGSCSGCIGDRCGCVSLRSGSGAGCSGSVALCSGLLRMEFLRKWLGMRGCCGWGGIFALKIGFYAKTERSAKVSQRERYKESVSRW